MVLQKTRVCFIVVIGMAFALGVSAMGFAASSHTQVGYGADATTKLEVSVFTKDKKPDWALSLHRQPVLDVIILILFTFHSIYGLRTIVMDFGYRNEKRLFWLSNTVASIISAVLIYIYFVMS